MLPLPVSRAAAARAGTSCAEGGVLGVLPGVIGTIQATEALKLVLGAGSTLVGRLLLYDAWTMKFRELKLRRDPACPICGDHPSIKGLIDYEEFCGVRPAQTAAAAGPSVPETTVEELKARVDAKKPFFLLDVREPHEFQISRIAGSTLIPLGQLPTRTNELPSGQEIIVHCKTGVRSARAVAILRRTASRRRTSRAGSWRGLIRWIRRSRSLLNEPRLSWTSTADPE